MNIYDDINIIKREGLDNIEYDSQGNVVSNKGTIEDAIAGGLIKDSSSDAFFGEPVNVGNLYPEGYGDSKYDYSTNWRAFEQGRSLEDIRAERQPWYDQFANNLANLGTIALTTAVDAYAGTAAGLVNMIINPEADPNLNWAERRLAAYVNNPISLTLNSIQKTVKEHMPTYQTDQYRQNIAEGKWHKNFFTAGFWGEAILENAGFTMGMAASGKLTGALLGRLTNVGKHINILEKHISNGIKSGQLTGTVQQNTMKALSGKLPTTGLDKGISEAVKNIKQASAINRNIATAVAVTGEARQEGINSSRNYHEQMTQRLNSMEGQRELAEKTLYDMFSKNPEMFHYSPLEGDPLQSIRPEYIEAFNQKLAENQAKAEEAIETASSRVASINFALNFPILYGSSLWQFSRSFVKGYDTQRGFRNNIKAALRQADDVALPGAERVGGKLGEYTVSNAGRLRRAGRIIGNPLAEMQEEMLQEAATEASSRYAGSRMNSFVGYKLDPESEQEEIGFLNSVFNGILDTYGDWSSYEAGFAGLFMGAVGAPNFTFSRSADGSRSVMDGGIWQDIREIRSQTQDLQAAADAINNRMKDPTWKAYYQGGIAHKAFEKNKQASLRNGDKFTYLNNNHAQFINDLMLFEKVGKTQDFYDMLDANIERFSTADKAEIASIAEEMRELGTNKETGVNMFRGKTDEQIVTEALEHNRSLREQADKYREISTNLRSLLGDKFTEDDEMSEMIYLFSQIDNFEGRATELLESLRDNVNTLNIPTLKLKTFPIVLQDEVRELNFVEIVNQATPTELSNWLMDIASTKIEGDFDYSELLFASVPRLLDSQDNLLKTIKDIHKSSGKRGLTQQQHKRIGEIKQKIKSIGESLSQTKERNDIMNTLNDLVLIENTRAKLVNTYNSFINAPQLLKDRIAKDKEDAAVKQEEIINQDIKESLKEAATVQDIRNIIAQEAKGKGRNVNNFIQELSVSDNEDFSPVVAEYVRIENTGNDIRNSQPYKSVSDDVQDGVDQLWNIVKNRSNSIEEALNPTVLQDDLGELVPKRGGAYPQEVREEIRDVFVESLNSIKERDAKYSNLKKESSVKSKDAKTPKAEPFKGDSYDGDIIAGSEVSLQDVETSEDNTDSSLQEIKTSNPPPQVENNVLQSLDVQNSIVDTPWNNGTFEIDIDYYYSTDPSTGKMRREFRKQGPPYSYAVDFLEEQGAFDFINSGNLKKGTKVYFVASNEYWDYLREKGSDDSYLQKNKPLLIVTPHENGRLTIDGQNYQVLGTFKNTLNPFIQKAVQDNTDSVDTSISTTVTQVTPGRISMGSERSLSSIISKESPALFGISTGSGNIETNGTNHDVLNVNTGNEDAGRLYLLVKGANGTRIPVAVRGKRLGEMTQEELFSDNDFFNELHKAIRNLAEKSLELTEEALDSAVKTLRNILFVGSKAGVPIRARNYSNGPMTEYGITIGEHFIRIANRDMTINDGALNSRPIEDISRDILEHLVAINTSFQINKSNINGNWNVNGRPYNNILVKSGILTTNVTSNSVRGAFFKMNPIDNNLKEITKVSSIPSSNTNNPSKKATTNVNNDNVSDKGDTTVSWEGSNYTINKKGQVFDANGNLIQAKDNATSKIVNGVKVTNYLNSLSAEELAKISFTGKELFPGSLFSLNDYVELPNGQVWTGHIVVSREWNGVGKEIDRVKRERTQKSSRTTPQELQAQLETKRQNAINSIKEASPEELEGGNVSPFSTNYGNKYISGISREDVELKVNSAHALELEELGFGPPPTTGMTIVEEVPLFGETSSSQEASGFGQENNIDAKKAERIISASFTGQGTTLEIEIRGEKRDFLLTWNRTNTNPILWGNKREDGSYTTTDVFPSKEDVQRLVDKYIPSKLLNLINEWTNASKLPAGKVLDAQAIAETKINAEIEQIKKTSSTQQSQEPPVRRIPKSKKTKTVLDIGIANISRSEIESKIQENKDHHKDNCNGIIPF